LEDWVKIKDFLWDGVYHHPKNLSREEFKEFLLDNASHPKRTIERIARIITTSYRMEVAGDLMCDEYDLMHDESEVKTLVENELSMLHGSRFQTFCQLFSRFCKIDYGLRFFQLVMRFVLVNRSYLCIKKDMSPFVPPSADSIIKNQNILTDQMQRKICRSNCLKQMTRHTCSILKRFVDDYGSSVTGETISAPLKWFA
jgi:hypothetical protein